jgi:predicted transcriptional regulator
MDTSDKNELTAMEAVLGEKNYPSLKDMPKKAREILILTAVGYTQDVIAKRFGCTQSAISQTVARYDPDGIYRPSMDLRREVIRSSVGTVALEAVRHLVGMTDQFSDYKPATLIGLISKLEGIYKEMSAGNGVLDKNTESSLEELAK